MSDIDDILDEIEQNEQTQNNINTLKSLLLSSDRSQLINKNNTNTVVNAIGGVDALLNFYLDSIANGTNKAITMTQAAQLSQILSPKIAVSSYDMQHLLSYGYIRECLSKLTLSQIMPLSLYEIIYKFSTSTNITAAFIGHVDCGKSTIIGRLFDDTGLIPIDEMNEYEKEARELGRSSFKYAMFCDKLKEERQRGVSIKGSMKYLPTDNHQYVIYDTPGHRDFIKNATKCISQADVGILCIAASPGEFESSIARGDHRRGAIKGMARMHAEIAYNVGIRQLIVLMNKMDATIQWNEGRYNECKLEIEKILINIGFELNNVLFIPCSGWLGDNIKNKSANMPWYKGFNVEGANQAKFTCYTLYEGLKYFIDSPIRTKKTSGSGIVSLIDIYRYKAYDYKQKEIKCNLFTGIVERGYIRIGQKVLFHPRSGATAIIESIGINHKNDISSVGCGEIIGIKVKDLSKPIHKRDVMLVIPDDDVEDVLYPLISRKIKEFTVQVDNIEHPGHLRPAKWNKLNKSYVGGYSPVISVGTQYWPCSMIKINWSIPKEHASYIKNPAYIKKGEKAEIVFATQPGHEIVVTTEEQLGKFSRLNIFDSFQVIMNGKVTDVVYT